jgi:hypothetical protein
MLANSLNFRPSATEIAALATLCQAYAAHYRVAFVNRSDILRLALRVAARLAKEGKLFEGLVDPQPSVT